MGQITIEKNVAGIEGLVEYDNDAVKLAFLFAHHYHNVLLCLGIHNTIPIELWDMFAKATPQLIGQC